MGGGPRRIQNRSDDRQINFRLPQISLHVDMIRDGGSLHLFTLKKIPTKLNNYSSIAFFILGECNSILFGFSTQ